MSEFTKGEIEALAQSLEAKRGGYHRVHDELITDIARALRQVHALKLSDLSVADLYEAFRTDGKVWFRSWSNDMHLVRVSVEAIKTELSDRGVSLDEARQEWKDLRDDE